MNLEEIITDLKQTKDQNENALLLLKNQLKNTRRLPSYIFFTFLFIQIIFNKEFLEIK